MSTHMGSCVPRWKLRLEVARRIMPQTRVTEISRMGKTENLPLPWVRFAFGSAPYPIERNYRADPFERNMRAHREGAVGSQGGGNFYAFYCVLSPRASNS